MSAAGATGPLDAARATFVIDSEASDRSAWISEALRRFEGPLLRYAAGITRSVDLARDVVQDAFCRSCDEDPAQLDGRLGPWLFAVCRNRAIDLRRKGERMQTLTRESGSTPAIAAHFNDDKKDAGEIGAGHTVTAFYEFVPAGQPVEAASVDPLKYQYTSRHEGTEARRHEGTEGSEPGAEATGQTEPRPLGSGSDGEPRRDSATAIRTATDMERSLSDDVDAPTADGSRGLKPAARSGELMTVKLRSKVPDGDVSKLIEAPVIDDGGTFADSSDDFAFALSVASFGMLLRGSPHSGNFNYDFVHDLADAARGADPNGYRAEFVNLVDRARSISAGAPRRAVGE